MRRVVVTGIGMVSPLGGGVEINWERLIMGEVGPARDHVVRRLGSASQGRRPGSARPTRRRAVHPDDHVASKDQRKMDDFIVWPSRRPTRRSRTAAGSRRPRSERESTGVMIGSGIGGLAASRRLDHASREGPAPHVAVLHPSALINLASGHVSILYGFKGPNHSVVTACSTGAHAIGDAARLIMRETPT